MYSMTNTLFAVLTANETVLAGRHSTSCDAINIENLINFFRNPEQKNLVYTRTTMRVLDVLWEKWYIDWKNVKNERKLTSFSNELTSLTVNLTVEMNQWRI